MQDLSFRVWLISLSILLSLRRRKSCRWPHHGGPCAHIFYHRSEKSASWWTASHSGDFAALPRTGRRVLALLSQGALGRLSLNRKICLVGGFRCLVRAAQLQRSSTPPPPLAPPLPPCPPQMHFACFCGVVHSPILDPAVSSWLAASSTSPMLGRSGPLGGLP